MLDLSLQNYMDWYVKPVMKIKSAYGFRVILKYTEGSERCSKKQASQQKGRPRKQGRKRLHNCTMEATLYMQTFWSVSIWNTGWNMT